MSLSNDIRLNGVDFTVVPGTYRQRSRDIAAAPVVGQDVAATRARRLVLGPFSGGQRQAMLAAGQRDVTAGWDSVGVAPVLDGQGVEPFPNETLFAGGMLDTPTLSARVSSVIAGNPAAAYVGIGRRIYKSVTLTSGVWSDWVAVADLGAGFTISGLAYYLGDLLVLLSTGQDIRKLNTATNALSVWRLGEKGVVGCGYKGQLIYAPRAANNEEEICLSGTKWNGNAVTHLRYLDSPILTMALFNGKVAIATRTGLWFMGGDPYPGEADDAAVTADTSKAPAWIGDPQPVMSHGIYAAADDFVFLCSYRGRLYTWLAGRVAVFDDSQEQGRWQRVGPEGTSCNGAAVVDDWLVVATDSRDGGTRQLWGFNGEGWWLLAQRSAAQEAAIWPCPLGGAGARDLVVFRNGALDYDLYRLKWRSTSVNTYRTSGTYTSSLLDGGDPTRDKRWLVIGCDFAQPMNRGNSASADFIALVLEYSLDGGVTWVQADVKNAYTQSGTRIATMQSSFGATPPSSRYLQVRLRYVDIFDWAPVLTRLWVEYEVIATTPRKREWALTIDAGDRGVRRDGSVDPQSGRQKIDALWTAWGTGANLTFLDLDNDTNPVTYAVQITAIEEKVTKPADAARWGESQVAIELVEV